MKKLLIKIVFVCGAFYFESNVHSSGNTIDEDLILEEIYRTKENGEVLASAMYVRVVENIEATSMQLLRAAHGLEMMGQKAFASKLYVEIIKSKKSSEYEKLTGEYSLVLLSDGVFSAAYISRCRNLSGNP